MRRAALLITLLALVAGSLGLWLLIRLGMIAYNVEHPGHGLLAYPNFWASNRHLVLTVPAPFILWGLWLLRRRGPTVDQLLLYMAVALLAFAALFFAAVVGLVFPWATIVYH